METFLSKKQKQKQKPMGCHDSHNQPFKGLRQEKEETQYVFLRKANDMSRQKTDFSET